VAPQRAFFSGVLWQVVWHNSSSGQHGENCARSSILLLAKPLKIDKNPALLITILEVKSMSRLKVAATQMACSWDLPANLQRAENLIREAASAGAQVILIQELFETPYFCIEQNSAHFELATTLAENSSLKRFQQLAEELDVVLPFSWFERANRAFYNSLAMVDAGGAILGVYRKSHIPNGPGYQEKSYFNPGDTGFRVWDTRYGRLGDGICWDQWFPEAARCMALMGAELLLYPTAIGSEPPPAITLDSSGPWQRTQRGHATAHIIPVIASKRIGTEFPTRV